jgi:hypothetical protein
MFMRFRGATILEGFLTNAEINHFGTSDLQTMPNGHVCQIVLLACSFSDLILCDFGGHKDECVNDMVSRANPCNSYKYL